MQHAHTHCLMICVLPSSSIDGFKKSIFEVEDDAEAPCFLKHGILLYIVVTLLGFSWAFRTVMSSHTAKRTEIIIKVRVILQQKAFVIALGMTGYHTSWEPIFIVACRAVKQHVRKWQNNRQQHHLKMLSASCLYMLC